MNKANRVLALQSLGNKCNKCDSKKNLAIHHIDGDNTNNSVKNLVLLCRSCHFSILRKKPKKLGRKRRAVSHSLDVKILEIVKKRAEKNNRSMSRQVEILLKKALRV